MEDWNGSVPAWEVEEAVERLRRDPPHPGRIVRDLCERNRLSAPAAARALDMDPADLERVLEGRVPITASLALRLEAANWLLAEIWMRMQADYDLAQKRLRQERAA